MPDYWVEKGTWYAVQFRDAEGKVKIEDIFTTRTEALKYVIFLKQEENRGKR